MKKQEAKIWEDRDEIALRGNPRKPQGEEGRQMLQRMNESHCAVTEWALGFFDFVEGNLILDIGCGGGATLARMSKRIQTGHLTGVDYSGVSVELSRNMNTDDIQRGKMDILEASVEKLPFADKTFDKIITVESFYFWPHPVENLKEVHRVLKSGGTFLLVADIYQKDGLGAEALENVRKYEMLNPTIDEFRSMFEQAGFSKIRLHTKPGTDWICAEGVGS